MKRGLGVLLVGVIAAALLVPAATAKPGNGNGPPAWAGAGSGGAKANGTPTSAGKGQEKKAEKAAQKAERRSQRAARDEEPADAPKHDNPAFVCKFERDSMGVEAFAERYGTNDQSSNAFGRCVSTEAHERDGATADDGEAVEPVTAAPADSSDEDADAARAVAVLRAFFQALTGLVF